MAESIITSTTDALLRRFYQFRRGPPSTPRRAEISSLLETEVIPRLHRPSARIDGPMQPLDSASLDRDVNFLDDWPRSQPTRIDVNECEVLQLAAWLAKQDLRRAWALVERKYQAGMDSERIAIDLLGATAAHLGALWVADRCSFAEVTLGTGYLHQMLRDLFSTLDPYPEVPGYHHRILLLPAPGEQHVLGMSILGERFRRSGWDVCGGPALERSERLDLARREHVDVVGFSVGAARWLEPLAAEIAQFRQASRNRALCVLVGGHAIDSDPDLVGQLGADGTAADPTGAERAALGALSRTVKD